MFQWLRPIPFASACSFAMEFLSPAQTFPISSLSLLLEEAGTTTLRESLTTGQERCRPTTFDNLPEHEELDYRLA